MPMEDYIDVRCPFCRWYLTDVDGIWECQEGCGACEYFDVSGNPDHPIITYHWDTPDYPFEGSHYYRSEMEVYNSEGKLIGGEIWEMKQLEEGKPLKTSDRIKAMDWMF